MKTITGNHIKLDSGRVPMPRTSPLLRKMLEMLVLDIAAKLEHVPPEQHEYLILEWRMLGAAKGESET